MSTDFTIRQTAGRFDFRSEPGLGAGNRLDSRTYRWLGGAFLLQAIASAVSGLLLAPIDLLASAPPDDMAGAMADLATNEWQTRASIVGEMVTAVGIVALGVLLFSVVRHRGHILARIAVALYLVEVAMLAVRETVVYGLWWTSHDAVRTGTVETMVDQANLLYQSQSFAYSLHMLLYAVGATIFYVLLAQTRVLPWPLIGLGLIAAPLAVAGTVVEMMGTAVPLWVFLPGLPFELGAGLWLALGLSKARTEHI
ncbi:MAG: DUF4386 domain-containing protein [Acidimicrobiia bacterium]|nr:DUF4386 domain-containing protein [Acidimicrobiia bacterium]